jgi:hypothetical protein
VKSYDPFVAPRDRVGPALRVVALAPLRGPSDLQETDAMKIRLIATVEARLREAGLAVIPPSEVDPVFKDVVGWRDGFYDPKTGKLDEARVKGAFDETLERLSDKFGHVDGFAFASVRVVNARLDTDWASWSGTSQYAGSSGWKRVFFLNRHSGTLRALTLVVEIMGKDGKTLYADGGGIQLLEKVDLWGAKIRVPKVELLTDEARNAAAVYEATDALVSVLRQQRASGDAPPPAAPPAAPAPGSEPPPSPAPEAPPRAPPPPPRASGGRPASA